jgi:hypothetical protein
MCDVLLPPGVNPTAVKYIYIYHIILYYTIIIIELGKVLVNWIKLVQDMG